METIFSYIVGVWFVAQAWLTGAAIVAWLAWGYIRLVRGR